MRFLELIPSLPQKWAILCAVCSLLPGVGTLIAGGHARDMRTVAFGLVMLLLFWTFLPWAWSILWGVLFIVRQER